MRKSLIGRLFLLMTLLVAGFAYTSASNAQDWGCSGNSLETCPDSDIGCAASGTHRGCKWNDAIDHCNCNLLIDRAGY